MPGSSSNGSGSRSGSGGSRTGSSGGSSSSSTIYRTSDSSSKSTKVTTTKGGKRDVVSIQHGRGSYDYSAPSPGYGSGYYY